MTSNRSFGDPNPRGLPGEMEGLWSSGPRRRRSESRAAEERLRIVWEEVWVEPPSAPRQRARLYENIDKDRWMRPGRGAFVIGPPGAGTSTFLQEAARDFHAVSGKRIALASMPDSFRLHDILVALRRAVGHETHAGERTDEVETSLYKELGWSNVVAIAIDGMEQLVHAAPRSRGHALMWLRHAAATGKFHLILSTPPALIEEMHKAYNGDKPRSGGWWLERRARPFQEYHLGPFRIDSEYVEVLGLWETKLPLRHASHLAGREIALHLYALCGGLHGRLARVLRRAAAEAITSGRERVTVGLLDDLGLRPPPTFTGFHF